MNAEAQPHGATPEQQKTTAEFMVVTGLVALLALVIMGSYLVGIYAGSLTAAGVLAFAIVVGTAWTRYGLMSSGMAAALFWGVSGVFFALVG